MGPLKLMLRLKPTPGTDTMVIPTMATMARGLLMPRLPLLPKLTRVFFMAATTATHTATTARGLLTLSLLLPQLLMPRLIPGTDTTVDLDTTVTATHTTATATIWASKK